MSISREELEIENREWIASLKWIIEHDPPHRVREILRLLEQTARESGLDPGLTEIITPYINTIHYREEEAYPGNLELERKIEQAIRWNSMALVVRANKNISGLGGHISTFASSATLFEMGFNHFFRGYEQDSPDLVYYQGHASPGIYARAFVEGRLNSSNLDHFRRETVYEDALSSYPHARLMPDFWHFPTVSMGFTALQAIYQARFLRYAENRKLKAVGDQKVWAFMGDGEMDEPESLGAITLASREQLDNLIFVVNCNLQRLDGPVRGNGKIIDELEGIFKGAGWNVVKVIWGSNWDPLFDADHSRLIEQQFAGMVDGTMQRLSVADGPLFRKMLFSGNDDLAKLSAQWSDETIASLNWGGHDPVKVYNAYLQATRPNGRPTVILAQTIKGYGMGSAGEASNEAHQQKKMTVDQLKYYRDQFEIPIADKEIKDIPYYSLDKKSDAYEYMMERRKVLQGHLPARKTIAKDFQAPSESTFSIFNEGSKDREVTTTLAFVQLLSKILRDKAIRDIVVPIIPDESRTFGMDVLFSQAGIYASHGQKYEPIDKGNMLYYKESRKGAILEEGITEAGCMASFIAAGINHTNTPKHTIPFFVFYSMFGFQRVGDLIWAAADARAKGFMIGGISGKTTLSGEGLQHLDGYSHLNVLAFPSVMAYDPSFAYELAVIIEDGIRRMYVDDEDLMYYITILNQSAIMPPMPEGSKEGILKGLYRFRASDLQPGKTVKVNLLGSGAIMYEVLEAADVLENEFGVAADIYSVTSYKSIYEDGRDMQRHNLMHNENKSSYIEVTLGEAALTVSACDYIKTVPLTISPWVKGPYIAMGADGFGMSDDVPSLRNYFELSKKYIVRTAVTALVQQGELDAGAIDKLHEIFEFDPGKVNPADFH
jgi:pyruvate dehydrogenase E1 component